MSVPIPQIRVLLLRRLVDGCYLFNVIFINWIVICSSVPSSWPWSDDLGDATFATRSTVSRKDSTSFPRELSIGLFQNQIH